MNVSVALIETTVVTIFGIGRHSVKKNQLQQCNEYSSSVLINNRVVTMCTIDVWKGESRCESGC